MDQHHHNMPDDHSSVAPAYFFSEDPTSPYMPYGSQMGSYQPVVHPQTRGMPDMHHGIPQYNNISMMHPPFQPPYASPPHVSLPLSNSPSPHSPAYDTMSPPLSGSDTSADGIHYHSNSSGANSPSSSRGNSLVHRHPRFNHTPSPSNSLGRRRSRSHDSDDDDQNIMGHPIENVAHSRKEATRRQRIEAEQRRRDELRDGYAKLKEVLPISNQKSSKVSLLERATNHIANLEKANKEMLARIASLEQEMQRLRSINEKISLVPGNETPSPGTYGNRPLSPSRDGAPLGHSLASVKGQEPPSEHSSPSASEGGY